VGAIRARVRADLRAHWRSWAATSLAIGMAGAVVLTAAAGARRTGTAYDRFLRDGRAEDVYLGGPAPTDPKGAEFYDDLERLPQVQSLARIAAMIVIPAEGDYSTPYSFAGLDDRYGTDVDRPNIVEGRRPDPTRADEVLVNRAMVKERHVEVGSTIDWVALSAEQANSPGVPNPAKADHVHLKVVGVAVYANEVVATAQYDSVPFLYLTPAFYRAHPTRTHDFGFAAVRLRRGARGVASFKAAMDKLLTDRGARPEEVLVADRAERNAQVRRAIQPQALALAVFAIIAAAASLLLVGQLLTRRVERDAADNRTLRALGLPRSELFARSMAPVGVVAVPGAALAVLGAALASSLMPIGPARLAEPHRGIAVNGAVLGIGFFAVIGLLLLAGAPAAWRAATASVRASRTAGPGPRQASRALGSITATGLPTNGHLGVRAALRAGRGPTGVPVRSALLVSGVAVALVIAVLTFSTTLDRVVDDPRAYGWNWDLKAGSGFFSLNVDSVVQRLGGGAATVSIAGGNYGTVTIAGGPVPAIGIDPLRGSVFPTLLEGRAPTAEDEIVLGTRTLRRAHKRVGDTVMTGLLDPPRAMRIVGRAVFPKLGAGSLTPTNLGEGAAVVAGHFADPSTPGQKYTFLLIRLPPGADVAAGAARISKQFAGLDFCTGDPKCAKTAEPPGDISDYARVRSTSRALAAGLVLIALGALGHLLVTSVRRRRRDLAVLRTLGLASRDISAITAWQATTATLAALLVGLPVGVALGKVAWRVFSRQLGVAPDVHTPVALLLLAVPIAVLATNLVAAVPARLAARTRVSDALRSE
jgi:ABC-type lipoprotein release transport system permease subunit